MTGLKYIIIENNGLEFPILFHQCMQHNIVASRIGGSVVSAGFWSGNTAYGESVSLKLKSRPFDTDLIASALRVSL